MCGTGKVLVLNILLATYYLFKGRGAPLDQRESTRPILPTFHPSSQDSPELQSGPSLYMAIDRGGLGSTYYYYKQPIIGTLCIQRILTNNQPISRTPVVLVPDLKVGRSIQPSSLLSPQRNDGMDNKMKETIREKKGPKYWSAPLGMPRPPYRTHEYTRNVSS